jgi:hypothetical protein
MDLYLPADYLRLREAIDDWRDNDCAHDVAAARPQNEPADPTWQTL